MELTVDCSIVGVGRDVNTAMHLLRSGNVWIFSMVHLWGTPFRDEFFEPQPLWSNGMLRSSAALILP